MPKKKKEKKPKKGKKGKKSAPAPAPAPVAQDEGGDEEEEDLMGDQSWAQAQSEEAFSTGVDDMFGVPPTRREQAPCTVADIVYAHELYITVLVS